MHIAIDILSAALGGPGQYIRNFLPHLARRAADDTIHVLASNRDLIARLPTADNVIIHEIPAGTHVVKRLLWQNMRMPGWCRDHNISVVFTAQGLTAMSDGPPLVVLHQDSFFFTSETLGRSWLKARMQLTMTHRTLERAAAALFVSHAILDLAERRGWIDPARATVVPYGVDVESLRQATDQPMRARLASEPPFLLSVNSLMPHKNVHTLLTAMRLLQDRGRSDIRLLIAGEAPPDRPYANEIRRQIDSLKLTNCVTLLGPQDRPALGALYSTARLYVTLSLLEAHPLTPVEAMGHNMPILCNDLPAFREVCGESAVYVNGEDAAAAAAAIESLWDDDERRAALGAAGREWSKRFSWTRAAEMVHDALKSAAKGGH